MSFFFVTPWYRKEVSDKKNADKYESTSRILSTTARNNKETGEHYNGNTKKKSKKNVEAFNCRKRRAISEQACDDISGLNDMEPYP